MLICPLLRREGRGLCHFQRNEPSAYDAILSEDQAKALFYDYRVTTMTTAVLE